MKIEEQDEETRAALAYETRALTKATERLLKLLDEFSLVPVERSSSGFKWNLVSRPSATAIAPERVFGSDFPRLKKQPPSIFTLPCK